MDEAEVVRARAAAVSVAASLGLAADDAVVVFSSNKLALRLVPCDVLARIGPAGLEDQARLELERARRLARAGCPVGTAHPGVPALVHVRDGFAVTLWTYHDPAVHPVLAEDYGRALAQLHAGLRTVDLVVPRLADRISEAQQVAADPVVSPELVDADRELLAGRLAHLRRRLEESGSAEQLIHGEPHPGNVLGTSRGPVFIDFETLCRGPVELDLAHAPEAVCASYPGADAELLAVCRQLAADRGQTPTTPSVSRTLEKTRCSPVATRSARSSVRLAA